MKNLFLAFLLLIGINTTSFSVEGMWIPSLIDMFYSDMKTYGLKLTKEQIYSTNQASLKDAIVQFNGGCTAEIVSKEGLILTNHHCGFSAIQSHSSVENDYLKNGFWAKNKQEELACPWLKVTFVKEIVDVTEQLNTLSGEELLKKIEEIELAASNGNKKAKIKPFNQGNEYFMLVTEDYNDIRLVGAPPSAIGKFGGDTDNWVWPRHTGDFSVFRIYADANNNSSDYAASNVPYNPRHSLPISLKPKEVGDFTMVYGFPGSTEQHYPSGKLKFYMDEERPARIKMRQTTLDILKPAMNESDQIRIQYASKQARIANAWKKWIGQIGGLKELKAIEVKREWEEKYRAKASERTAWKNEYFSVINDLNDLQNANKKYEFARALFIEYFYVGPEFIQFSMGFDNLIENYDKLKKEGKLETELERLNTAQKGFFKNYNKEIDKKIFESLTPLYINYLDGSVLPSNFKKTWEKTGENIFKQSIFLNSNDLDAILTNFNEENFLKLAHDPAYIFTKDLMETYLTKVNPNFKDFSEQEEVLMTKYVKGILEMFPDKKTWADANSTLRIAYGKIDGSAPRDGMEYHHFTTIDGIMQKYDPENPDFELTQRFIELYNEGDFGQYTQDGKLWVCFTASNHTTGGNSGSPVIDAEGNLMGINFDRSWESTMSDFMFDESRCRNIIVDIRYVLWVIDKYGEAAHLIEEMEFVQ